MILDVIRGSFLFLKGDLIVANNCKKLAICQYKARFDHFSGRICIILRREYHRIQTQMQTRHHGMQKIKTEKTAKNAAQTAPQNSAQRIILRRNENHFTAE